MIQCAKVFVFNVLGVISQIRSMNRYLLSALEEFGLSKNEARAYLALLFHGPQKSSDLAYKASIPRPKIYSIINRLVKKDLAIIINTKPIIVDAISPYDAFDELVRHYEELAESTKHTISLLDELRSSKRDPMLDRTYRVITDTLTESIENAIKNAKHSILLTINALATNIINECKGIIEKQSKDVMIKMLTNTDILIDNIEVRKSNINSNNIIIDEKILFLLDANANRCYLFNDKEFVNTYTQTFYNEWNRCLLNIL